VNSFIAPVTDIETAIKRYNAFKEFVSKVLVKDHDYGEIPGTKKPTLLKAGAEKLGAFFGIRPVFVLQESVNDWNGKDHGEPFFFREYKCQGYRSGELIGEGVGSCNSWEKKYRYRWMNELEVPETVDKSKLEFVDGAVSEFAFAVQKAETSGKYGKPAEYWQRFKDAIENGTAKTITRKTRKGEDMDAYEIGGKLYAVPNHDPADQVNTIDKMAQKRALVAMILIATNASDYFTQDMEDFTPSSNPNNIDPDFVEGSFKEVSATETFAQEVGAETGELLKYLDAKVVKMVAKVRGLTSEDAAKGLQEWLTNGRIKKEMTLAQFEALAKVD
jgi:hypothetical protein